MQVIHVELKLEAVEGRQPRKVQVNWSVNDQRKGVFWQAVTGTESVAWLFDRATHEARRLAR